MSAALIAPRDRRALLVGAAALAGLVVFIRGVPAAVRWNEAAMERAAVMRLRADAAATAVGAAGRTESQLVALNRTLEGVDDLLLDGANPSGAGAALAELIAAASEDAEVALGSVELRVDQHDDAPIERVAVRTTITGDAAAVAYFIASLEVGPALLRIRELGISASMAHGLPGDAGGVTADIVIDGLYRARLAERP
ncbi:MAG: hypothetical protein H0X64_04810 [Gemmatimonadaceae bacterium]|nr:hypothetical protein [Gemmatimonadaceae bacterium]